MSDPSAGSDYPIAAVSKLTGVSCHALRIWERRYGFPVPRRSASGHRRYSPDQVQLLGRLARSVRAGCPVSEGIAELLGAGAGARPPAASATRPGPDEPGTALLVDR